MEDRDRSSGKDVAKILQELRAKVVNIRETVGRTAETARQAEALASRTFEYAARNRENTHAVEASEKTGKEAKQQVKKTVRNRPPPEFPGADGLTVGKRPGCL